MKQLRDRLSDILAREDVFFTGEELAARCGVTRAAVWKAVQELREAGHIITADRRRGYRLTPKEGIHTASLLRALPMLGEVEVYDTLPSTNARARALAEEGAPHGSLVVARMQTEGRGRFDRRFESPADSGLYLSLIVRPDCAASLAPHLTTCTAVAVAEAVESLTGAEVKIKWVNDLWMGERKICGILTEGALDIERGSLRYAVVGIGLNVQHADLPAYLAEIATSVEDETGKRIPLATMLIKLLDCLLARLEHFADKTHLAAYRSRSALDGRRVKVCRGDEQYEATVRGIGEEGELLLSAGDGREICLTSGEVVSVRRSRT